MHLRILNILTDIFNYNFLKIKYGEHLLETIHLIKEGFVFIPYTGKLLTLFFQNLKKKYFSFIIIIKVNILFLNSFTKRLLKILY